VQRWTGSTFVNESTTVAATATTYRVTGLTNGERYAFRVLARNRLGLSPPSNGAAAIPVSPLPYAPQPSSVPPTVDVDIVALTGTATITWSEPLYGGASAVARYVVQRSTDGSTWTPLASVRPATNAVAQSYSDRGLAFNTVYRYRVAAVNASGQGPWGTTIVVRTPTRCPDRSIAGFDGAVLVTRAFQHGTSCDRAAAEQDRIARKEVTWNPDGGWGSPSGTVLEPCLHYAFGSSASRTTVRYTCFRYDVTPYLWFLIGYPSELVPAAPR
jgi:hypothetical protein